VGGPYMTIEESEAALERREELCPGVYYLMPVDLPGKTVLDFGCGPGHDTLLFLKNGAERVFYADASALALATTERRLHLYGFEERAEWLFADRQLPTVDYIHCAGVLHHMENPLQALRRLRNALRPGGEARVMIYDGERSTRSQSDVPVTEWWTHDEFIDMADAAGWDADYVGSYPCSAEWRPDCWAACYRLVPA
jgi:SAM-dependent methyltransferase